MNRSILIPLLLLAAAVGAGLLYLAQRRDPVSPPAGPSAEMMGAMHRMHEATNAIPMTGDIDRDFAALMIPHHRSAVEMARVYLKHGKDPELRRLSENVIASQEAEIRQLKGRGAAPAEGVPHSAH